MPNENDAVNGIDTAKTTDLGNAALRYAQRGWAVFPLHGITPELKCTCGKPHLDHEGRPDNNRGKHPRTAHGLKDASKDPDQVRMWWRKWLNSSIGIATGSVSGVIVIDTDGEIGANQKTGKPPALPG